MNLAQITGRKPKTSVTRARIGDREFKMNQNVKAAVPGPAVEALNRKAAVENDPMIRLRAEAPGLT